MTDLNPLMGVVKVLQHICAQANREPSEHDLRIAEIMFENGAGVDEVADALKVHPRSVYHLASRPGGSEPS